MKNRLAGALLTFTLLPAAAIAQNPAVSVTVDASANRHAIDPRVYGVAYATATQLTDLNCPLNRYGGNPTSRYNWNLNAANRCSDWYFESLGYPSATPGADADDFIGPTLGTGAQAMMTIPMVGWVAKLGPGRERRASFLISKYGAQTGNDWEWYADAGNGISSATGQPIVNDPNDANLPATHVFQQGFVQHLIGHWGTAANGGLQYYIYDNEPSIWHSSHRDVHPDGAGMEEVRDKILAYGAMIKAQDPNAVLVGPEEWGWSGYFWSGQDIKYYDDYCSGGGPCVLPDRTAHGGADYMPWLLDALHDHEVATGERMLHVFALHYYPQGGEFGNNVTAAMQERRNRSTRSLWDTTYVDESWIASTGIDGGIVKLIPRMKAWVAANYPGLEIGLTEYNWGAEGHMNGATTQADILGILGREGLDLATRWTTPGSGTPTYQAMKIYRNYDGAKSTFGDTSVKVTGGDPDQLATFAAERTADGALTVMVINKVLSGNTPVTVNLASFTPGSVAQVYRLASASATIQKLADKAVSGNAVAFSAPPQSVTLLVVPVGDGTPGLVTTTAPAANITTPQPFLKWNAEPSATAYGIQLKNAASGVVLWDVEVDAAAACATTPCQVQSGKILGTGSYQFLAQARNGVGHGPWSAPRTFAVKPATPVAPALVSPKGTIATRKPAYTWKGVANTTHYIVRVQNMSGATVFTQTIAKTAACAAGTCKLIPVNPLGTAQYQWSVRGKNANVVGPWSAVLVFKTP